MPEKHLKETLEISLLFILVCVIILMLAINKHPEKVEQNKQEVIVEEKHPCLLKHNFSYCAMIYPELRKN